MKKGLFITTVLFFLISMSIQLISANTPASTKVKKSKSSCVIIVKNSSGSLKKDARVVGDVCGDISCSGQTKAVYTDSEGSATIYFSKGCKLCAVYVDGKEYSGTYKDGGTYTIRK